MHVSHSIIKHPFKENIKELKEQCYGEFAVLVLRYQTNFIKEG